MHPPFRLSTHPGLFISPFRSLSIFLREGPRVPIILGCSDLFPAPPPSLSQDCAICFSGFPPFLILFVESASSPRLDFVLKFSYLMVSFLKPCHVLSFFFWPLIQKFVVSFDGLQSTEIFLSPLVKLRTTPLLDVTFEPPLLPRCATA